jgi:cellulose synthase/poly-beta-1,6-N-acetylglucosamine synthase-like glycosyltransferase
MQPVTPSPMLQGENSTDSGFLYKLNHYIPFNTLPHHQTALYRATPVQYLLLTGLAVVTAIGLLVNWHMTLVVGFALFILLYFVDLLFSFYLVYKSYFYPPEIDVTPAHLETMTAQDMPMYTVLCPLYKESIMLPIFVEAMQKLEYPIDKLQILLLLEEEDRETIATARDLDLPSQFQIVVVPNTSPKTKPKALNYGMKFATGEYIVIYDAEDDPDTLQLKKAACIFSHAGNDVACIQSKLDYYNDTQNLLTRLFTLEYSLWFNLTLPGLQALNAPIPLGGTSNHYRAAALQAIGLWDSFNVTEDADMGIRIARKGYRTLIMDSTTFEEANSMTKNWFKQRSRWVKGYMQTYLVHLRGNR